MEKLTLKLENVFDSIIHSRDYNSIRNLPEYDNLLQAQKHVLKNNLIPKVKQDITELVNSSREYEDIKINKVSSKYTKEYKYITLELVYSDEKENVFVIARIFEDFKRLLSNKLLAYELFVF